MSDAKKVLRLTEAKWFKSLEWEVHKNDYKASHAKTWSVGGAHASKWDNAMRKAVWALVELLSTSDEDGPDMFIKRHIEELFGTCRTLLNYIDKLDGGLMSDLLFSLARDAGYDLDLDKWCNDDSPGPKAT